MKKVSVILVNYNGREYNSECIESILNSSYENIEIIIVDNASTDDSIEIIESEFKSENIRIIKNKKNQGFSIANNNGIRKALDKKADYIILLNNDTTIDKYMIENMVNYSLRNKNIVLAPKIMYYNKKDIIWSAGGYMNWYKGNAIHYGINEFDSELYNTTKEIDYATGCCWFIPRHVIEDVGMLGEEYFLYFEDVDYCYKIRNKGYKIIYYPKATVFHKVSASTGGEESPLFIYYITRNRLEFNRKYNKKKILYRIYIYMTRTIRIIIWGINGKLDLIIATIKGMIDYRKKTFGKSTYY